MPVGTTSNEALRAELNNWFRQIQSLHKATLSLKLRIILLSKLVAHNAALYAPTARQMPSTHVLARKLGQPLFTAKQWRVWTQDLVQEGTVSKATLPLRSSRLRDSERIRSHTLKRPAVAGPSSTASSSRSELKHRNVFALSRTEGVLRANELAAQTNDQEKGVTQF